MDTQLQDQQQTILVVDDNPTNIEVLFDVLDACGYRVAIAKSGEVALKRLQSSVPDLILLDVMMPGIDGFETCRQIKTSADLRDIPVIFMTALSDTVDKVKGLKLGAVDYITKPIQHEEVLARINVHLQLRHLSQTLETQVKQRTAELTASVTQLKEAQIQLVQGEKMASLGQLVAGIAHEINNPINFIYGNLRPAEDYIEDLLGFVDCYQTHIPEAPAPVQDRMEEIDLAFLRKDLPQLIRSMKLGADRIRQIVLSLRTFSRLDEKEFKPVDIHEGLDSTLLILQYRLKRRDSGSLPITVIKDYGALPPIECYPSQINQVFMNILANAIDALEERLQLDQQEKQAQSPHYSAEHPPTIQIQTLQQSADRITIRISDNGPGIPEELQPKLFEAFFTTKSPGKGTGLGLSISYQLLVEKHHGMLSCHSKPGEGTQFVIELPVHQTAVGHPLVSIS
ncbi:MAG TPA: response regulator [Coleofasciculaceae cyanobacterium]|jgi:signal transduction histidine kinase